MDDTVHREGTTQDSGLFQHEGIAGTHSIHLLREVLLTYRQLIREMSERMGLSGAQFEVMRELALANRSATVSALSRALGSDPAAVSRLISGLQQAGLVSRESDDRDGRRRPVVLTEDGRRLMVSFHAKAHEYESALTGSLDRQSIETTMQVLRSLRDALDAVSRRRV